MGAIVGSLALPGQALAQRCRVADIEVNPTRVPVNGRAQLLVIFRQANGVPCDVDPTFTASSSNNAIARYERGFVVGVSAGAAAITVRTGTGASLRTAAGPVEVYLDRPVISESTGTPAPPVVTPIPQPVNPIPVAARGTPGAATLGYQPAGTGTPAGIEADPPRMLLLPGESRFFRYRVADVTGANAEPLPLIFAVEPAAALAHFAVDTIGVVTAIDTGRGAIRITAANRPTLRPTIVPVEVRRDSVVFTRPLLNMAPQTTDTVVMRVPAQNRSIAIGSVYRFSSADTNVAKVYLYQPVVEARQPGQTIITATNPLLPPVQLAVNVFRPAAAIQLSDSAITIAIRQSDTVVMRPVASDSSYIREAPFILRGADSSITLRYDSATGALHVTGRASGETRITMRVQSGRDSTTAIEKTLRIRVVAGGLKLSRTRVGTGPGARVPIRLDLLDEARRVIAGVTPEVRWRSSDTAVARFENNQVIAGRVGRARLTGTTPWESTATIDVFVVPEMVVVIQRAGAWNIYGRTTAGAWSVITSDSLVESFPAFSPDLTQLAFVVTPPNRPRGGDLVIADADSSGRRVLHSMDSTRVYRPQFVRPAGEQVVFELSYEATGRSEIWAVGVDGRNSRRLPIGAPNTFSGWPAVSPDGRQILYVSQRTGVTGGYDVFIASFPDGTGERRLTTHTRADDSPAWHPDGRSFFFLRDEEPRNRQPSKRVFRYDLSNDSITAVSPVGSYVAAFGVNADGTRLALNVIEGPATRLAMLDVATGTLTPVALDVSELLGQASPASLRPNPPAEATPAAAPPNR